MTFVAIGALRVYYSTFYLQLLLVVLVPSPLNASSSLESSNKRRSRKSQPQRVVSEAETPVIDLDVEEMEVDGDLQLVNNINGPQMVNVNGSKFVAHWCLNPYCTKKKMHLKCCLLKSSAANNCLTLLTN